MIPLNQQEGGGGGRQVGEEEEEAAEHTHDVRLLHYVEPHSADWTAKHVVTDATTVSKNVFCNGSVTRRKNKTKQQILLELCIIKSPVVAFLTLRCAKAKDLKLFKIQKK